MSRSLPSAPTRRIRTRGRRSRRAGLPLLLLTALLLSAASAAAQERYPGERWMRYATPEEAGWSAEGIERAKAYADSIGSAAFLLVHDGAVVAAHGDYARRYMCHSVRKSLLSGLMGVYVEEGVIDPEATLAELGVEDRLGLTEEEKGARVVDLLRARSGVYHPAAYETAGMAARRPERGSHEPGSFWYYNNWDFNALGAIFRQETGEDLFEAFEARIAGPVGMQDYRPQHGYYHLEPEHSRIPAYPFRMSARDLARFGLLFEREGRWSGGQVVPASWVEESTRASSETDRLGEGGGYGYMWWTLGGELGERGAYSALGVGTQAVTVVPELDLVFVHRVDTYAGDRVRGGDVFELLRRLVDARRAGPAAEPELVPLEQPRAGADVVRLARGLRDRLVGSYRYPSGHTVEVRQGEGRLLVSSDRLGTYGLVPLGRREFLVEDARLPVFFVPAADGDGVDLVVERLLLQEAGFLAAEGRRGEALAMLERAVEYYPTSVDARRAYGRGAL
ncbi:MAG TPA: serine hydrolase, partial [Longimicrobiales bacterium]|nr:serine hydrolase [Longimicrobiales bacterium]